MYPFVRSALCGLICLPLLGGVAVADESPASASPPPASAPTPPAGAAADQKPDTKQKPAPAPAVDLKQGALTGRVVDASTGKPVPDATVAVMDASGKVTAWTKTDADGKYLLAVDTLKVLRLQPSRHRGLLSRIVGGAGKVVAAPVKLAGKAVSATAGVAKETVRTGGADLAKGVAASAVTGNPLPAVQDATKNVVGATQKQIRENAKARLQDQAKRSVLDEREATPKEERQTLLPGEVRIAVSAPQYKEANGPAGTVWMEASPDENTGPRGRLETVKLALVSGDKSSEVANEAILLSDAKIEPGMAPAGGAVKVSVKLQVPEGLSPRLRVFAREDRKRVVAELKFGEGGVYAGDLRLDPKTPVGPTTVTVVALREDPVEVKLPKDKDDPLLRFAAELDDLDPDRPYEYDPRIMAGENRIDLALKVLDPKKQTPAP